MASWADRPLSCSGSDEEVPEATRHNPEEPHSQASSAQHAPQTHPHTEGPSLEHHQAHQPGPQVVLPNVRQMLGDTAAPKRLGRRSALLTEVFKISEAGVPQSRSQGAGHKSCNRLARSRHRQNLQGQGGSSQHSLA